MLLALVTLFCVLSILQLLLFVFFFFFNDTATTEIYTLSLHDALPICPCVASISKACAGADSGRSVSRPSSRDRKSTRLNSSHLVISYAVFCLKKKKTNTKWNCAQQY